jgi:N-methylhydantoinase A
MLAGAGFSAAAIEREVGAVVAALEPGDDATVEAVFELRYRGQSFELPVAGPLQPDPERLAEDFAAEHERRYGYREDGGTVELVNVRIAVREPLVEVAVPAGASAAPRRSSRNARFGSTWRSIEVIAGEPQVGLEAVGPCVFELPETTMLVPAGWHASVDGHGTIVATAAAPGGTR